MTIVVNTEVALSLKVPDALMAQAREGTMTDADFLGCIQQSLPYAWKVVSGLAKEIQTTGQPAAEDGTPPPTEEDHAQLLRLVGSDAMRAAVEKHFGMRLAFQNCCKLGMFQPTAVKEHAEFTSPTAQVLNQTPALINC